MNPGLLRTVRYASYLGICILAGFFAGRYFFGSPDAPAITPQMLTGAPTTTARPEVATVTAMPDRLPEIRLPDLDGQERSLAEWSDGPLIINFWATWCAPCLREMPMLEATWQANRDEGLSIVGIAVDRLEAVGPYIEQTGVNYPILVGQSAAMEAAEAFGPDFAGLPYTVFAAAGGLVVGVWSGELHPEDLGRLLAVLRDASAGTITIDAARARFAE